MLVVALDTNVILDYVLKRPSNARYQFVFEQAADGTCEFYMTMPVVLEIEWTLRSYYAKSKTYILAVFDGLLDLPWSNTADQQQLSKTIGWFRQHRGISFDDCVILSQVLNIDVDDFITGDKKLARVYRSLRKAT